MRLSTHTFARRGAQLIQSGAKLAEAMELPMVTDILATLDANEGARFFILGPYQSFKSAVGQMHLGRNMQTDERPALWYAPTEDFAKDFADLKWNPFFDGVPTLERMLYRDKAKRAKLRYNLFGADSLLILSAKTENDRHGKTACDIYMDEPHRYESGWIAQIRNRHGSYPDEFKEVFMSTGLTKGTEAAIEWESTDQRTWLCLCPACQKHFEPLFAHYDTDGKIVGGLRYERAKLATGLPDEAAIAQSLGYECPHCHEKFGDSAATRGLFNGTAANPRGRYEVRNHKAPPKSFGWNFHGISIRSWLPIAIAFEKAQLARKRGDIEPLANWVREECAGIWVENQWQSETKLRPVGDYRMGDAWDGEAKDPAARPVRACCVDVQQDHFVMVIRSWSATGSRLRWAEKVTTPARIRDLCMEHGVIPERVYLDGRHETQYTRRTAAQFGWRVLMGEDDRDYFHKATGLRRIFSEPRMVDAYAGTGLASGVIAEINFSKQSALSRLHLLRTMPGRDGAPIWTAAKDAPEWYWKEIEAHYKIKRTSADGSERQQWVGLKEDHAGDCEAMQIVFASMAGLIGAESLETVAASPKATG